MPRVRTYTTPTMLWQKAGSPIRSDEEIAAILQEHCSKCPLFVNAKCSHKRCACNALPKTDKKETFFDWIVNAAMMTMLRRKTSRCPLRKWGIESPA